MDECARLKEGLGELEGEYTGLTYTHLVLKACRCRAAARAGDERQPRRRIGRAARHRPRRPRHRDRPGPRRPGGSRLSTASRSARSWRRCAGWSSAPVRGSSRPTTSAAARSRCRISACIPVSHFAAVVNPPQAAILAVGTVRAVPVVRDGEVVPGHVMTVTLSCDHRIVDGALAGRFLRELVRAPRERRWRWWPRWRRSTWSSWARARAATSRRSARRSSVSARRWSSASAPAACAATGAASRRRRSWPTPTLYRAMRDGASAWDRRGRAATRLRARDRAQPRGGGRSRPGRRVPASKHEVDAGAGARGAGRRRRRGGPRRRRAGAARGARTCSSRPAAASAPCRGSTSTGPWCRRAARRSRTSACRRR